MSFGTFMDSLLFNVQADLGTLAGEVKYLLSPVTPNFIMEHRQAKCAESWSKLNYNPDNDIPAPMDDEDALIAYFEGEPPMPAKSKSTQATAANSDKTDSKLKNESNNEAEEIKAIETSKSNPVDNVDEVLKQLADMANDAVKRNEFMEQLKGDSQMMDKISTYMANEFIKDFKEEFSNDKELPDSIKTATLSTLISALQGLQKEMAPTTA